MFLNIILESHRLQALYIQLTYHEITCLNCFTAEHSVTLLLTMIWSSMSYADCLPGVCLVILEKLGGNHLQ